MEDLQTYATELPTAPAVYSLNNAASLKSLAAELAQFVKEKKMTTSIQGREYVHVEAWTFAGLSIGLTPIVLACDDISRAGHMVGAKGQERQEIRYRATVELFNVHTSQTVGRAFAICSNEEAKKKFFDEYSIASMAQTRATGKVYRLPLGWLMQAAGFQATPAEEMDSLRDATIQEACYELLTATDLVALRKVSTKYAKQFGKEEAFYLAGTARKASLSAAPSASPNGPRLASEEQRGYLSNLLRSHLLEDVRDQLEEKLRDASLTMDEASRMLEEANRHMEAGKRRESFDDVPY